MKELLTFPKDFWWGSAWSAEQAEGRGDTGKAKLFGSIGLKQNRIAFTKA